VQNVKPSSIRALPVKVAPLVLVTHCVDKPTRITGNSGFGPFPRFGRRTLPPNQGLISIEESTNMPESERYPNPVICCFRWTLFHRVSLVLNDTMEPVLIGLQT